MLTRVRTFLLCSLAAVSVFVEKTVSEKIYCRHKNMFVFCTTNFIWKQFTYAMRLLDYSSLIKEEKLLLHRCSLLPVMNGGNIRQKKHTYSIRLIFIRFLLEILCSIPSRVHTESFSVYFIYIHIHVRLATVKPLTFCYIYLPTE